MVYLSKIYTRTGDDGTTGLGDGSRVQKTAPRVQAYGDADELGAMIGMAESFCTDAEISGVLRRIQNDLFDLGADLCCPAKDGGDEDANSLRVLPEQVARLEAEIDHYNANLEPLKSFILSGGTQLGATLHLARTVARRCERSCLLLMAEEKVNVEVLKYLNRLSDHLFVLARAVNQSGSGEILWQPGMNTKKTDAD